MAHQGISTRRVKDVTTELCGREFSSSTVSRLTEDLDEQVQAWAERQLDQEYPFLVLDAMQNGDSTSPKVRRQKAVRSTTAMLAVGISEDGQREILGLEMAFGETEQSWRRFIRQLKERGLSGVELATSDAHEGLKRALEDGFHEATAVLALPEKYRKRLRTTNMLERFIQEIRSRERQDPVRASKEEPAQSRNVVAH